MVSKKYELSDMLIRKYKSLLFRLLTIAYASIFLLVNENCFSSYYYVLVTFIYLVLYLIFLFRSSTIRLCFDTLYILFVVWGKGVSDISAIILILFPLFNSINFSGTKKIPYLLFLLTMANFLLFTSPQYHVAQIALGCFGIFVIDRISNIKWQSQLLLQQLFDCVDTYYVHGGKMYKVYLDVIKKINEYLETTLIRDIMCFIQVNESEYELVNSSSFVYKYSFNLSEHQRERLNQSNILQDITLVLDDSQNNLNICFFVDSNIKNDVRKYIFVVLLNEKMSIKEIFSELTTSLEALFQRIARILHNERNIRELKRDAIKDLRNKAKYVAQAERTMHFIRNRLSPYKTLIQLIKEKEKEVNKSEISTLDSFIFENARTAHHELDRIVKKADFLLEKENNPFTYTIFEMQSFNSVFTILRSIWRENFTDNVFFIGQNVVKNKEIYEIKTNIEAFEILISDWVSNMSKYKKEKSICDVDIEDSNYLSITFSNDFVDEESVLNVVKDINSNGRQQIIRRSTHGLFIMKEMLTELGIDYKAEIQNHKDDKMLVLTLKIKLNKKSDEKDISNRE